MFGIAPFSTAPFSALPTQDAAATVTGVSADSFVGTVNTTGKANTDLTGLTCLQFEAEVCTMAMGLTLKAHHPWGRRLNAGKVFEILFVRWGALLGLHGSQRRLPGRRQGRAGSHV